MKSIHHYDDFSVHTFFLRFDGLPYIRKHKEESDGTKRLFDMIDMLLTDRPDTVFVVDELERSLHPKLTEHFLQLFMEAHDGIRMQLVFTTHEDTIMDQSLFRRDEIWFVERDADNAVISFRGYRFKGFFDAVFICPGKIAEGQSTKALFIKSMIQRAIFAFIFFRTANAMSFSVTDLTALVAILCLEFF